MDGVGFLLKLEGWCGVREGQASTGRCGNVGDGLATLAAPARIATATWDARGELSLLDAGVVCALVHATLVYRPPGGRMGVLPAQTMGANVGARR